MCFRLQFSHSHIEVDVYIKMFIFSSDLKNLNFKQSVFIKLVNWYYLSTIKPYSFQWHICVLKSINTGLKHLTDQTQLYPAFYINAFIDLKQICFGKHFLKFIVILKQFWFYFLELNFKMMDSRTYISLFLMSSSNKVYVREVNS